MVGLYGKAFILIVLSIVAIAGRNAALAQTSSSSDILHALAEQFQKLQDQLNSIQAQLNSLEVSVNSKMSSVDGSCTVRDISEAIRIRNFRLAEEKLFELADKNKVSNIVHDVYAGSLGNADIILEFAKILADDEVALRVFSALHKELRTSGQSAPFKLIALVESLERELTRRKKASPETKAKSQTVAKDAIDDIKVTSTSVFKMAMIADKYQKNVEVQNLARALSHFKTDVSKEVIEHVVDSVFGVVAAEKILNNIASHEDIPQVIAGLTAIFNRFNFAGNLNNDATLELASHLHQLQLREKYSTINPELRQDVDRVVQQLPLCAKNLFFHTSICFWNKGRGEYIYAASTSISHDNERRSIYAWYPGDIKEGAYWHVKKVGNDFLFKNRDHKDEYMYVVDDSIPYKKDLRYVFTWIAGNNTDPQSAWGIELDGDHCYIKSNRFNEYLFASDEKYDQLNSYLFTWKPGTSVRSAEFQWQIRNCGQA